VNRRIRVRLLPAVDPAFRAEFERACLAAPLAGVELDAPDAARVVQDQLQSNGYPSAEIALFRSVDDYRNHVSHWFVWRDGRPLTRADTVRARAGSALGVD
jgi:hypothetical protein